ncbi:MULTISPECIES: LacI family DNA-binding transcriptional regulator [unclassified Paenibacillus]|uniref:LacI family DNA-binding transcriptional regulator n=1 Tax=unclassified Paenibacillus TaxID=185978 RepID=UPI000CFD4B85|nr:MULTISPECIES: LacI family DNA-binding transcriptional regulator [unclassified Paenibacillus]PRA07952.1 LacI family transcriptional regulator [Paenibacillus sp. MYb63]PRA47969.1 LacI family transcriptional regulator [Paenibacillus sp. MYb67]QZN74625.1 LacI family transcriptional regulator [Paenibacillus sp. DR312]
MITIYDIAKKANVSAMTVSKVINHTGRISSATRERVQQVIDELGYIPNSNARSLVLQRTQMLSLLITDITNPFYTTLARGAEDAAHLRGYRLLFGNSDEDYHKEKDYVDAILSTRVDGVLFAPAGDRSLTHLKQLQERHIPFVFLDRTVPGITSDVIAGDSREGAIELIRYLVQLGHRRIALVNGSSEVSTARLREEGYVAGLREVGVDIDPELVLRTGYRDFSDEEGLDQLLSQPEKPTAIFAANNMLAIGVIRLLRKRGLRVPEDISVVCFDDLDLASAFDPFLTVAAQPAYDFGFQGVQMLIDRIEGKAPSEAQTVILPSELRIRASATAPREQK